MAEDSKLTQKDLNTLNKGISSEDKRYFTRLDDPRLLEIMKTGGAYAFLRNLRAIEQSVKEGRKFKREHIDSAIETALAETGNSEVKPVNERTTVPFSEYLRKSNEELARDPRYTPGKVKEIKAMSEEEARKIQDSAPLTEKIRLRELELEKHAKRISTVVEAVKHAKESIGRALGEDYANGITTFYGCINKLLGTIKEKSDNEVSLKSKIDEFSEIEKKFESRIKESLDNERKLQENRDELAGSAEKYKQVSQAAIRKFFLSFDYFSDPTVKENSLEICGNPVRALLSRDGARIINESPLDVEFDDFELAGLVLSRIIEKYDLLLNSACTDANEQKNVVNVLKEELEKKIGPSETEKLVSRAKSCRIGASMEFNRKVDEAIKDISKEDLAVKYLHAEENLERMRKTVDEISKQRDALVSRRSDVSAVMRELDEISALLTKAGHSTSIVVPAGASSSRIIESVPDELRKVRLALEDIVKEKGVVEKAVPVETVKSADYFLNSLHSRFSVANDVLTAYATGRTDKFSTEPLDNFSFDMPDAGVVLLKNYKRVLEQLRDVVEVDIVNREVLVKNMLSDVLKNLPASLKKKDVMALRRHFADLIRAETVKVGRVIAANKELVPELISSGNISLDGLLKKTGFKDANVACLFSYVKPLYEMAQRAESVPSRQSELCAKYSLSFAELETQVGSMNEKVSKGESVFQDARKLDSSIRTKKDAVDFVEKLCSEIKDLTGNSVVSLRKEIMSHSLNDFSYDNFRKWLKRAYNSLKEVGNGSAERQYIYNIVGRLSPESTRDIGSSIAYLRGFVHYDAFMPIDEDLKYMVPLNKVLGDFSSGHELYGLIKGEIKKIDKHMKVEQGRVNSAEKFFK